MDILEHSVYFIRGAQKNMDSIWGLQNNYEKLGYTCQLSTQKKHSNREIVWFVVTLTAKMLMQSNWISCMS